MDELTTTFNTFPTLVMNNNKSSSGQMPIRDGPVRYGRDESAWFPTHRHITDESKHGLEQYSYIAWLLPEIL